MVSVVILYKDFNIFYDVCILEVCILSFVWKIWEEVVVRMLVISKYLN